MAEKRIVKAIFKAKMLNMYVLNVFFYNNLQLAYVFEEIF